MVQEVVQQAKRTFFSHTAALTEVQLFEQVAVIKVILRCVICRYDAYSVVEQSNSNSWRNDSRMYDGTAARSQSIIQEEEKEQVQKSISCIYNSLSLLSMMLSQTNIYTIISLLNQPIPLA